MGRPKRSAANALVTADEWESVHVGTAALGCPVDQSSTRFVDQEKMGMPPPRIAAGVLDSKT